MYFTLTQNRRLILPFLMLMSSFLSQAQRQQYRTFDGSNNNLNNPQWGAAYTPLFRELPANYSDGFNALAGANRPNPRLISNRISNEKEDIHNRRGMAGLFYSWGQFIDHDMTSTPTGVEKAPIPLPSDESKFTMPISFTRSLAVPGTGVFSPREQLNTSNSWLDASMVYGNDKATADWLRTFSNGKLWVSNGNLLPYNTTNRQKNGVLDPNAPKMDDDQNRTKITFAAGDHRAAEHPGLTSFHTLFVREHNAICDRLINQGYRDDETIYQMARREVAALIQSITYGQWLYALGVELKPYNGYNESVRPDVTNLFATAAYRWHTMVENDIIFRDNECRGVGPVELPLKEVFFNINIVEKHDIGVLLKGLSVHRSYETDVKVNSGLRNFLFGPIGTDLVAINIQRGRDHGLPSYNTVREYYTGTRAYTFSDITKDGYLAGELEKLYGNVDNVDLWVGCYAEDHLEGKSVGRTVDAITRRQFENLRDGDYYFYLNDPGLASERTRISNTTLADVIARNSTAGNFQSNVFFVKSCSDEFDDLAKAQCSNTPRYDGWTLLGRTSDKTLYKWNGSNVGYYEARVLAERLGGTLLRVNNSTENDFVKSFIPVNNAAWLDMGRNVSNQWQYSGVFDAGDAFAGGATPTYYNWKFGEPNNVNKAENNAVIGNDGKWNDVSEGTTQVVIAEVRCDETPAINGCLTAYYYNNKTLSGSPALIRQEGSIDFDWQGNSPAIGINTDNFSARFEGNITPPTTGVYTFEVVGDDGYRLWIGNNIFIDKWTSLGTQSNTIYLTKGVNVPFKLEYFDSYGNAAIKLKWKVPQDYALKPSFSDLQGSYYNNTTLSGSPAVTRAENSINFDWGLGAPVAGIRTDNFSARYVGKMTAPVSGIYTYTLNSDKGIRLWVNNNLIVDKWNTLLSVYNEKVSIYLDAGVTVPIKVEYFSTLLFSSCKVDCASPVYGSASSAVKFKGCPINPTSVSFSDDECYAISARHNGKVSGVVSTTDGVPVQQNMWTSNNTQLWKIKKQNDNYFKVENVANSNKVIEVNASSTAENAKVVQRSWYSGDNQKWNINRNLAGYYTLRAKHSNKALSVPLTNGYSSTDLAQLTFNNDYNQQWVISVVGCPVYANRRSLSFEIVARRDGSKAAITWASNVEDVAYFELERMNSNTQKFEVIGKVDNNRKSDDVETYTTFDEFPLIGENAYRIIAYTSNGTKVETEVEVLNFTNLDAINIYPNPAEDVINVDLTKFAKVPATVLLYDSYGRIVMSERVDGQTENIQLNVGDLNSGRYLIRVAPNGQDGITKQVVIIHQ